MRASTFTVRVITPERVVFERPAVSAVVPVHDGYLGVLPNHAPLLSPIGTGILTVRDADGSVTEMFVHEGFLEVRANLVRVVADTGERADEIDIERARAAEKQARERLAGVLRVEVDLERTERALRRSLVRQRLVERRARKGGPR